MIKLTLLTGVVVAVALSGNVSASVNVAEGAKASSYREFEGMVLTVNRQARVFTLRDDHRGRVVTIKTGAATRYERGGGFSAIRRGLRLDVRVQRVQGAWVATRVDWFNYGGGYHEPNQDGDLSDGDDWSHGG